MKHSLTLMTLVALNLQAYCQTAQRALPDLCEGCALRSKTSIQEQFNFRNGWTDQASSPLRFDDHGNAVLIPETAHPWHSVHPHSYDRNGSGSLDPGELSRFRVDLRRSCPFGACCCQ